METTRSEPVLEVICGSQLYGLETPDSDIDYGHVYVDPKEHLFGHSMNRHRIAQIVSDEEDVNGHWLREFVNLCVKGNPNAIEWMWAHPGAIRKMHPLFKKHIFDNADAFLGLVPLTHSHFGFATSQIKKMKEATGKVGEKRRNYVKKFGYDIKFASHAIRLMHQLIELVDEGRVVYPIPEGPVRSVIMEIKLGKMSEEAVIFLFNNLRGQCDEAVARNRAGIPEHPDKDRANKMLIAFFEEFYYNVRCD